MSTVSNMERSWEGRTSYACQQRVVEMPSCACLFMEMNNWRRVWSLLNCNLVLLLLTCLPSSPEASKSELGTRTVTQNKTVFSTDSKTRPYSASCGTALGRLEDSGIDLVFYDNQSAYQSSGTWKGADAHQMPLSTCSAEDFAICIRISKVLSWAEHVLRGSWCIRIFFLTLLWNIGSLWTKSTEQVPNCVNSCFRVCYSLAL